jgi:uncharacterized protein (TIGR03492 family)
MVLLVSAGHAEDMIGAGLASQLQHLPLSILPLVGSGHPYRKLGLQPTGPLLEVPSGGFPFNSLTNFVADMRAGFVSTSWGQWQAASQQGNLAQAVVVVGDAYALAVGWLAAGQGKRPLYHLQPLISSYYIEDRSVWERLRQPNQFGAEDFLFYERWLHRYLRASFVRDQVSEKRAQQLGMHKARFLGSMAMDILPAPERSLEGLRDARPLLALLPGTRADVTFSLPIMLEAAALLPEMQAMVAWALPIEQVTAGPGWQLIPQQDQVWLLQKGSCQVLLLRGAFSAILHQASLTLGTAGTGNEQSAGLGIPVVGFATPGPQFVEAFARRQKQLLGDALTLTAPNPVCLAQTIRNWLENPTQRLSAGQTGRERIGPAGALPQIAQIIAQEIR